MPKPNLVKSNKERFIKKVKEPHEILYLFSESKDHRFDVLARTKPKTSRLIL